MALQTGRNPIYPPTFALTTEGVLLIADGINAAKRWDGLTSAVENAGITAPTAAPAITPATGGSATNGNYSCAYRYIDDDGQPSSFSPILDLTNVTAGYRFPWASILVSSDSRVVSIQLWRTTPGDEDVFYLVATLANSGTPTYSDTLSDTALQANTALRRTNVDGSVNADRFTPPPSDKADVNIHQERSWWSVDRVYSEGNVKVTSGSASVTGIGTAFTSAMVGRYLYVDGATVAYEIQAVGSGTALTLTSNYAGSTNKFAMYGIRSAPNHRNLVMYSSLGEPEAVYFDDSASPPVGNAILLQEDLDEQTAKASHAGSIYIFKRRHVYRVSCDNCDPTSSGGVYLVANRGCVNTRTLVRAGESLYVMDYEGIYVLDGGGLRAQGENSNVSDPINDLWRSGINWSRADWFHAVHDTARSTVKFFVCLDGSRYPRHALAYNYRTQTWVVEEYWQMLPAATQAVIAGPLQVLAGGEHNKIWRMNAQQLDAPKTGTYTGTVTSATWQSLTDSSATFNSDLLGSHVCIISGRGKRQVRRIVSVTSTTLRIKGSWDIEPDSTSSYLVGGIGWVWRGGIYRYARSSTEAARTLKLHYQPTTNAASLDLRFYVNHDTDPVNCSMDSTRHDGVVTTTADDPDVVIDLKGTRASGASASGYAIYPFDDAMETDAEVDRWISPEMRGFGSVDTLRIAGIILEGASQ